jgi:hypothetical protein
MKRTRDRDLFGVPVCRSLETGREEGAFLTA